MEKYYQSTGQASLRRSLGLGKDLSMNQALELVMKNDLDPVSGTQLSDMNKYIREARELINSVKSGAYLNNPNIAGNPAVDTSRFSAAPRTN